MLNNLYILFLLTCRSVCFLFAFWKYPEYFIFSHVAFKNIFDLLNLASIFYLIRTLINSSAYFYQREDFTTNAFYGFVTVICQTKQCHKISLTFELIRRALALKTVNLLHLMTALKSKYDTFVVIHLNYSHFSCQLNSVKIYFVHSIGHFKEFEWWRITIAKRE